MTGLTELKQVSGVFWSWSRWRREYNRICHSKFEDFSAQNCVRKKKRPLLSIKRMKMTILYIIYLSHPCVTRMCYFDAICDPVSWYQRIFHTTGSLKNNLNKTRLLVTLLWALYYFLNTHFISKGKFKYMYDALQRQIIGVVKINFK